MPERDTPPCGTAIPGHLTGGWVLASLHFRVLSIWQVRSEKTAVHRSRSVRHLVLTACLITPCLAANPPADDLIATEPLSRARAAEILARSDEIADSLMKQLVSGKKSRTSIILEDVRDVMVPSSEWRWYSRDHGILLAIPVRERLGIAAKVEGEQALADIARRLLHQKGWANPPVQVVFIEPALPWPVPPCVACGVGDPPAWVAPASLSCGCH